jgi:hypothetical protein
MTTTPTTPAELFRSLDLTLTVRAAADEDDAWMCVLARPDGRTYEIESVTFFDVDPDTGDEWTVEPEPTRVLGVLAGGDGGRRARLPGGRGLRPAAAVRRGRRRRRLSRPGRRPGAGNHVAPRQPSRPRWPARRSMAP